MGGGKSAVSLSGAEMVWANDRGVGRPASSGRVNDQPADCMVGIRCIGINNQRRSSPACWPNSQYSGLTPAMTPATSEFDPSETPATSEFRVKFSMRSFLKPLGVTANALAKAIGVPPNRITAILKDERGVTGDTAIRLGTFFRTSAEFWMNLQMTYDLRNAEKALPARVRKSIEDNRSVLA